MKYQRCTQCVMDTSEPKITFDKNGICNHCHKFQTRTKTELFSKKRRDLLLKRIKAKKKGKYDCIIGVSGGVDSTFLAYLVKEKFKLNPLAVHLDNGWNSELAVSNIHKTLTKLKIDLHTEVIDWDEFRDLQIAFLKSSIADSEVPSDHAITATLYRTAARFNISFILNGGNVATEGILPESWVWSHLDFDIIKDIHKKFGNKKLKTFPTLSLPRLAYYMFFRKIRNIPLLNYLDFNKQEAKKIITEKLGWEDYGGKHFESIYTRFFQAYILPKKFNIDKRLPHLSTLIL